MAIDAITEMAARALMRRHCWSPVGVRLRVDMDDSGDAALAGASLIGIIRGYDQRQDGTLTRLLVELDRPIDYGAGPVRTIRWIVTEPCLRWRRTSRLLLSWSVARIVEASSFVDSTYSRTIGIARLSRCRSSAPL